MYLLTRRKTQHLFAAVLCAPSLAAMAQSEVAPTVDPPPVGNATTLDEVTSTATRAPRPLAEIPATVTVVDSEQLERQNAVRPQDAIRYEPGVAFSNQPLRGGGGNFIIRGIGDNRVRVLTDGVRLPDFPESNIGAGTFTRDFVDLENIRRLEIVRGPASALYGSDAIGGVVNYITKDPADYLDGTGRNTFLAGRAGYSGADRSFTESLTGAARAGDVDVMGIYTRRDGHEVRPNGSLRANPQDYTVNSFLGRMVWRATPSDTLRLTGEILVRETATNLLTDRDTTPGAGGSPSTTVQNSRGEDRTTRGRVQLDWAHTEPLLFADRVDLRLSWSRLERREQTTQDRYVGTGNPATAASNRLRYSDFRQEQEILGSDLQFRSTLAMLGTTHRLTYGLTLERIETARPRDRYELNLATGVAATTVAGETFPNKNFPDTTTYQTGAYLQDEFRYGRFGFTPAIRLDWYSLRAHPDAEFQRSAQTGNAAAVRNLDAFAASPKFGITYNIDQTYSLYSQYARGFRAPPYDTANFGFTNRVFGYQILPNGELKPEYVDSFEAGLRGRFAGGSSFQLTGFYNRYSDFIATQVIGTAGGLQQFQYRNLSSVEIYGFEARGEYRVSQEWQLRGSAAYARAEDLETRRPVDNVDPLRAVVGLAWQGSAGFGAEANLTGAIRNRRTSSDANFQAPAYAVLDLAAHYDLGRGFTINAGLFNVTDTKYFLTSDIAGLAAGSAQRDLYAQPGRYAAVNLIARF